MNPTREQFEMAARAAGVEFHFGGGWQSDIPFRRVTESSGVVTGVEWNPHLPGTDNAMLAAGLKIDQEWTSAYAWAGGNGLVGRRRNYSDFPGTETERRAKAMAFAVFLVAVEIGRTMKEAGK